MSRFVRPSKYRHVFGTASKRDQCYDNLRVSTTAWDTNLIKANPLFLSINWDAAGGGAFLVVPLNKPGKLPQRFPLFTGHSGPVLDTDFANFNDYVVASAAEDGKVRVWNIPHQFPIDESEAVENFETAAVTLHGHTKKATAVLFHPTADNVLASSSADLTIRLWDVEAGRERQQLTGHSEVVQSFAWNWDGNLEGGAHLGIKGSRVTWLGNTDRLITTGFSRASDRQIFTWDAGDLSQPLKRLDVDTSSGVLMPFFDQDINLLYVAGKFEAGELHYLSGFQSSEPQRGVAFLPKRALDVLDCEIARAYRVCGTTLVEPVSFRVPRKAESFQSDLYPSTPGGEPALTAAEYFSGKTCGPRLISLENGVQAGPKRDLVARVHPTPEAPEPAVETRRLGNERLKATLRQKEARIQHLETQVERLSTGR
ncbi:Coronin-like protein crn1 [Massospora cicadina]|nr:Coronin-like protein crn1 [Massospora cicadina]